MYAVAVKRVFVYAAAVRRIFYAEAGRRVFLYAVDVKRVFVYAVAVRRVFMLKQEGEFVVCCISKESFCMLCSIAVRRVSCMF